MSIENVSVIDVVSIDKNGDAVLTIADHLEWDDENTHLLKLQNKMLILILSTTKAFMTAILMQRGVKL